MCLIVSKIWLWFSRVSEVDPSPHESLTGVQGRCEKQINEHLVRVRLRLGLGFGGTQETSKDRRVALVDSTPANAVAPVAPMSLSVGQTKLVRGQCRGGGQRVDH